MANDIAHLNNLLEAKKRLVDSRRNMASRLGVVESREASERLSAAFVQVTQLITAVDAAIEHERALQEPEFEIESMIG